MSFGGKEELIWDQRMLYYHIGIVMGGCFKPRKLESSGYDARVDIST